MSNLSASKSPIATQPSASSVCGQSEAGSQTTHLQSDDRKDLFVLVIILLEYLDRVDSSALNLAKEVSSRRM